MLVILAMTNPFLGKNQEALEDIDIISCIIADVNTKGEKPGDLVFSFLSNKTSKATSESPDEYSANEGYGDSIGECILDASSNTEKTLFLGQVKTIILTKAFAEDRQRMYNFLDYAQRDSYLSYALTLYLLDDEESKLNEKIKEKDDDTKNFLDNIILKSPMQDCLAMRLYQIAEGGGTFYIPLLELKDSLTYQGIGVIRDYQFETMFPLEDSIYYQLITCEVLDQYLKLDDGEISILKSNKKLKKEDGLNFTLTINMRCEITTYPKEKAIERQDAFRFDEAVKSKLEKECSELIRALQKNNADIFGLTKYMKRYHPKELKQYEEEGVDVFGEANVRVVVKPKVVQTGIMY